MTGNFLRSFLIHFLSLNGLLSMQPIFSSGQNFVQFTVQWDPWHIHLHGMTFQAPGVHNFKGEKQTDFLSPCLGVANCAIWRCANQNHNNWALSSLTSGFWKTYIEITVLIATACFCFIIHSDRWFFYVYSWIKFTLLCNRSLLVKMPGRISILQISLSLVQIFKQLKTKCFMKIFTQSWSLQN